MKRVGVIGCGWLGRPLFDRLSQLGYTVFGTQRSTYQSTLAGMHHWDGQLPMDAAIQQLIRQSDALIVTLPPQKSLDVEANKQQHLLWAKEFARLNEDLFLLYTSSTSVYGDKQNELFEKDHDPNTRAYAIEKAYLHAFENVAILRFGGLIGPQRDPFNFFATGRTIPQPHSLVHMTHLDDAIESIAHLLRLGTPGLFNVVSPAPIQRKDFYNYAFSRHQAAPPLFQSEPSATTKQINCQKITEQLGYTFRHPSALDALDAIPIA